MKRKNAMTRQDWCLALLATADGGTFEPVEVQKLFFLLQKQLSAEVLPKDQYLFIPYNYGPFAREIYSDIDKLAISKCARVVTGGPYNQYSTTPDGLKKGKELLSQLPEETQNYCRGLSLWIRSQSFEKLVSAVYKAYPEYRSNSIFRG